MHINSPNLLSKKIGTADCRDRMEEDMTAYHSPIAILAKPLSGIYSCISRTTGHYIEMKAQRVRLAQLNNVLSELDPHILKDIGMEGFDRLYRRF
jgi:hypothetical protein